MKGFPCFQSYYTQRESCLFLLVWVHTKMFGYHFSIFAPSSRVGVGGWASACSCIRGCKKTPAERGQRGQSDEFLWACSLCFSAVSFSTRCTASQRQPCRAICPAGPAEWASTEVKYQGGTHTLAFSHTPPSCCPEWFVACPLSIPGGEKCFWPDSEGKARMAALNAHHCF